MWWGIAGGFSELGYGFWYYMYLEDNVEILRIFWSTYIIE